MLNRKKIENYCPLKQQDTVKRFRRKLIAEPLFTSYVFVRITENELLRLKDIEDIINVVYWKQKPATLQDTEIEMIKNFLKDYSEVRVEKGEVNVSAAAFIDKEPMMEVDGNVYRVSDNTIRGYLPSIGYYITGEVGKLTIELIGEPVRFEKHFHAGS